MPLGAGGSRGRLAALGVGREQLRQSRYHGAGSVKGRLLCGGAGAVGTTARQLGGYQAVQPPSTIRLCPVT